MLFLFVRGGTSVSSADTDGEIRNVTQHASEQTLATITALEHSESKYDGCQGEVAVTTDVGFVIPEDEGNGHVIWLGAKATHSLLKQIRSVQVGQDSVRVDRFGQVSHGFWRQTAVGNPVLGVCPACVYVITVMDVLG